MPSSSGSGYSSSGYSSSGTSSSGSGSSTGSSTGSSDLSDALGVGSANGSAKALKGGASAYRSKKTKHYGKQKYGKKAASFGASAALGTIDPTGSFGRVQAGVSLHKTYKHIAELKLLADAFPCACSDQECEDVLVYAIWQKQKKEVDKALRVVAIPVLTTLGLSIYRTGRKLYKKYSGTAGVAREEMAEALFDGCEDECPLGSNIVGIIVGKNYVDDIQDAGNFEYYKDMLMDKLASQ